MFQHLVRESFIIETFLTTVSKPSFTSKEVCLGNENRAYLPESCGPHQIKQPHDWHSGTLVLRGWPQLPDAETKIPLRVCCKVGEFTLPKLDCENLSLGVSLHVACGKERGLISISFHPTS